MIIFVKGMLRSIKKKSLILICWS